MNRCGTSRLRRRDARQVLRDRRMAMLLLALALLAAIVTGVLRAHAVAGGDVRFDDGTVWLTSSGHHRAVRFNAAAGQADASVRAPDGDFDVAQHDGVTMLFGGGEVNGIDPSTVRTTASVEATGDVDVLVSTRSVALVDAGNGSVWASAADDFGSWSPQSRPADMMLGRGGLAVMGHDGSVYGYRPEDGTVLRLDATDGGPARIVASFGDGARLDADDFTVVGALPVIAVQGVLCWPSGSIDTGLRTKLTLQAPDADGAQGSWVAAADGERLIMADLSRGGDAADVRVRDAEAAGTPARPVSSGGCVHAAWSRAERNYLKVCSPDDDEDGAGFVTLKAVSDAAELTFRVNHRRVLLNDTAFGDVWDPTNDGEPLDVDWGGTRPETETSDRDTNDTDGITVPASTCSEDRDGVLAHDDDAGVRVGTSRLLDVLGNDEQHGCAAISLVSVTAVQGVDVRVTPVHDGRYLHIDATGADAGTGSFSYEASDGAGHVSSAQVVLSVVSDDVNHAPERSETTWEHELEQGASFAWNALEAFTDPDGDPLMLVAASSADASLSVTYRTNGMLTASAGTDADGRVGVELIASDGRDLCSTVAYFSIRPSDTLPPLTDPLVIHATPGRSTIIDLADSIHGTSARMLRLVDVSPPSGTSATPDGNTTSFSFSAPDAGTYHVRYTVAQGALSTTGHVRVDVAPDASERTPPIAVDDVASLERDGTAVIDPLDNDLDPAGGVLALADVQADAAAGVSAGIVEHHLVHLSVDGAVDAPIRVPYTVVNEAGASTGSILLLPSSPTSSAPPRAEDMVVTVRCGGMASVDVTPTAHTADDSPAELIDDLRIDDGAFQGFAFVSGNVIRYRAGEVPGDYPVDYTVRDDEGRSASGTVVFRVHERDAAGKASPAPRDVAARAAAGSCTRIPIPLSGIDEDGDDVVLLGLGNSAPSLGRITEVGADYLTYEAYPDAVGTDVFSYAVEDWTGRRVQARVRIAVFHDERVGGVHARDDVITARPGTRLSVPVLDNDIVADGSVPKLSDAASSDIADVTFDGGEVSLTVPDREGVFHITYQVRDEAGFTDVALLRVEADDEAPPLPPSAVDYRVPSADTIDRRSVDVDVSALIASPSGDLDALFVSVPDAVETTASCDLVDGRPVVSVVLGDEPTTVPYTVTDAVNGVSASAFIQVPAYGVFPPTVRPKAPELVVDAGRSLLIDIADHVRVGPGKRARIASPDSVSATRSDGDPYVDDHTLRFTARYGYDGPASITFTVVDGDVDGGGIVSSAVITLPVRVVGDSAPAPVFSSPIIPVGAGESTTIDLTALTRDASGARGDGCVYEGTDMSGDVSSSLRRDGRLTLTAAHEAPTGTLVSVPFSIRYDGGLLQTGVTVQVTASTRPLMRLEDRSLAVRAGDDVTFDVLEDAYNPFPGEPLTVVGCEGDTPRVPVSCAGGMVTVQVPAGFGAATVTVRVSVQDATRSTQRQVTAVAILAVMDRPDPPLMDRTAASAADGTVDLRWLPATDNGAPVVDYEVRWDAGSRSCGTATNCRIDGLVNGMTYRFTVRARNEVGWSDDSLAVQVMPDRYPPAPSSVMLTGGYRSIRIGWTMPGYTGSRVDRYVVTLTLSNGHTQTSDAVDTTASFSLPNDAIADGVTAMATVHASNRVGDGPPCVSTAPAAPWGDPDPLTLELTQHDDAIDARVSFADLRNAGCGSLAIGDVTVPCETPSVTLPLSEDDYGHELSVMAVMVPRRDGVEPISATATITPETVVRQPDSASIPRRGRWYAVRWMPSDRTAALNHVDAPGKRARTIYRGYERSRS